MHRQKKSFKQYYVPHYAGRVYYNMIQTHLIFMLKVTANQKTQMGTCMLGTSISHLPKR